MNIRETVSYIFILLFVALMFAFIFLTTGGGPFWRVFCICVIFSFSIGFINRGLCELTYPKVKNLELHFKIFLHIPLLFVGSFMGLIIANYICYLYNTSQRTVYRKLFAFLQIPLYYKNWNLYSFKT